MFFEFDGVQLEKAIEGEAEVGVVIEIVKDVIRSIPNRGIGYGVLRYLNSETAQCLSGLPRPQILFNYLGRSASMA